MKSRSDAILGILQCWQFCLILIPGYIAQRICLLESQQSQLNREVLGDALYQKWGRYVLNRTTESGMSHELYL